LEFQELIEFLSAKPKLYIIKALKFWTIWEVWEILGYKKIENFCFSKNLLFIIQVKNLEKLIEKLELNSQKWEQEWEIFSILKIDVEKFSCQWQIKYINPDHLKKIKSPTNLT
jgi:hypothetical protein